MLWKKSRRSCMGACDDTHAGHDYECSGIFATAPRDPPGTVVFRETVYMGDTDLTQNEVLQLVQRLGNEFKGNRYHLLQRNCNHFASEFCNALVGKPVPYWVRQYVLRQCMCVGGEPVSCVSCVPACAQINRLAGVAVSLHCLLPMSWVPPLQPPSIKPGCESNVPCKRCAEGVKHHVPLCSCRGREPSAGERVAFEPVPRQPDAVGTARVPSIGTEPGVVVGAARLESLLLL